MIRAARERAKAIGQHAQICSPACQEEARQIESAAARMERYSNALPGARAARDLNELGDDADGPTKQPCLTRLPLDAASLNQALGIDPSSPGAITDKDLRDDKSGYRAALYRDEGSGRLIMVSRDTQPNSLVDWKTNIDNGLGNDTDQYKAARRLSSKLAKNGKAFDIAGYSKGGGLAQEAGLMSPHSNVYVFNSAGLNNASLTRTGQKSFESLSSRTHAFNAEDDFMTYMNNTTDPDKKLANAKFLRKQLDDPGWIKPMQIQYLDPSSREAPAANYEDLRASFFRDLDSRISKGQVDFPPVRAASQETIPNSVGTTAGRSNSGWPLNARGDEPTLGKLAQHQISNVVGTTGHPGPLENQLEADRRLLSTFRSNCG